MGLILSADGEFRVAVGSPGDRRSTVWKVAVTGAEVYIFSHMFGGDAKVSLHASGDCQLSGTSAWVMKVPGRKNADRHFHKWHEARPIGTAAKHIFRVVIPDSELRAVDLEEEISAVRWLTAPGGGSATVVEFYITPPSAIDPSANAAALPLPCLCSLKLGDDRWLVVLHHVRGTAGLDVEGFREAVRRLAREGGRELLPQNRVCVVLIEPPLRSLVELCPA